MVHTYPYSNKTAISQSILSKKSFIFDVIMNDIAVVIIAANAMLMMLRMNNFCSLIPCVLFSLQRKSKRDKGFVKKN